MTTENNSPLKRLLDWCAGQVAAIRYSYQPPSTGEIDDDEVRQEIEQVEADIAALSTDGAGGGEQHQWDRDGERCVKCGAKDWMDAPCHPPDDTPRRDALEAAVKAAHFQYFMNKAPFEEAVKTALRTADVLLPAESAVPDDVRRLPDQLRVRSRMASRNESAGERLGMRIAADELEEVIARCRKPAKVNIEALNRVLEQQNSAENKHSYVVPEAVRRLPNQWRRINTGTGWYLLAARRTAQQCAHELDRALAQTQSQQGGEAGRIPEGWKLVPDHSTVEWADNLEKIARKGGYDTVIDGVLAAAPEPDGEKNGEKNDG